MTWIVSSPHSKYTGMNNVFSAKTKGKWTEVGDQPYMKSTLNSE
jgi:hypothetical protein